MLYEKNHFQRSSVLWFHLYKLSTRNKVIHTEDSWKLQRTLQGKKLNYYLMSTEFLLVIMKTFQKLLDGNS